MAFSDFKFFVLARKNDDSAEFKVHLIHRKQVPLLHNTVLILCDEGAGLVALQFITHLAMLYNNTHNNAMYISQNHNLNAASK